MKAASLINLVIVIAALGGTAGCREQSAAFPLSLGTLAKIHDGQITSFEERRGEILVHLTDRFGDGHIHLLDYRGVPKEQALTMLRAKRLS